jgi:CBS domain-containing protein
MAFLSELIGKPVADVEGDKIGTLEDVVTAKQTRLTHPIVAAIQVKRGSTKTIIPITDVAVLFAPAIPLSIDKDAIIAYTPREGDLFLVNDVLDKQIIDTDGVRVVRVNDLEIKRVGNQYVVTNVDIGGLGLLRRMGLARQAQRIGTRISREPKPTIISWDDVELLPHDQTVRLKVPGEKIADLHPADLAEIISDLTKAQSGEFLDSLNVETLADTLEEVEPDFQASLIEDMPDERVADVLEEMAPDEAADLLAELPKERKEGILELMEDAEAEDVRKLLAYPEDSAGGIMTTEYVTVPPNLTAFEAMTFLRENAQEAEQIFYVYVTDEQNKLIGVFSLSDLVLAKPNTPVTTFMHKRVVSVRTEDTQEDVAQLISKYNLLAVPVVDEEDVLLGTVTSDDALDKIIPTAWKKRLPRMFR